MLNERQCIAATTVIRVQEMSKQFWDRSMSKPIVAEQPQEHEI